MTAAAERDAAAFDAADLLAPHRAKFVAAPDVAAYLDGNSLGRPLRASVERVSAFLGEQWGVRLIRGWGSGGDGGSDGGSGGGSDDGRGGGWLELPLNIGDELGRVALGVAPGQITIGDSTTVLLYKLVRAALDARPGRREIVIDRDNFPTDRYLVEGIAAERGVTIRWIETDAAAGVTPEQVAEAVGPDTALAVLSHVAYRSGFLADVAAITEIVQASGALVLWDLSHSVGVVPTQLDAWGVDLAVGCTYKYLNGGPGSPAFCYVRAELQGELHQPIWGWLGSRAPFEMGQGYQPADGIRAFLSGTPSIVGMLAIQDMIALIGEVGIDAIRAKSVALTEYAISLVDELLPEAELATPRDADRRGSQVTINHDSFADIMPLLWERGVIPDFRRPNGIRLGLSPLSTSFAEVAVGIRAIAKLAVP